jgi:membrane protease YdiL (CAAX protease family)
MDPLERYWVVGLAIAVEGGLLVVAEGIGRLLGRPPVALLHWEDTGGLLWGLAATVPMVGLFLAIVRWPVGPLRAIQQFTDKVLCPLLAPCTVVDLAGISLLAGLGEEMMFRGVIQGGLQEFLPVGLAVAGASLLFGVLHAVTFTYAVLASLMGAYLGWLWLATGNLAAPALTHGLYDFLVLLYLLRGPGSGERTRGTLPNQSAEKAEPPVESQPTEPRP